MRNFFYSIYNLITGPLYRKLHREMSMQLQEITKTNIEHHERTSRKIFDELLRLNYLVESGKGSQPRMYAELSQAEISTALNEVESGLGIIEVCHKHELPISAIFELQSKFQGTNLISMSRARELEQEREQLARTVEELTAENIRLAAMSRSK